jgi:hypothetical protein
LPDAVKVIRVGVTPDQLRELGRSPAQAGYEFDAGYNSATEDWAETDGIWIGDKCYAIEVEALEPSQYIPHLIDAIVQALGGDEAVRELFAAMASPDWYTVKATLNGEVKALSELWMRLRTMTDWSQDMAWQVENPVEDWVNVTVGGEGEDDAWRNQAEVTEAAAKAVASQENLISPERFVEHVTGDGYGSWQPVGSEQANQAVLGIFRQQFEDEMRETGNDVDRDNWLLLDAVQQAFDLLSEHGLELSD